MQGLSCSSFPLPQMPTPTSSTLPHSVSGASIAKKKKKSSALCVYPKELWCKSAYFLSITTEESAATDRSWNCRSSLILTGSNSVNNPVNNIPRHTDPQGWPCECAGEHTRPETKKSAGITNSGSPLLLQRPFLLREFERHFL